MEPFRRVVVAVGDPGGGDDVLPYARFVAALLPSAEFHMVHVDDPDDPRRRPADRPVCRVLRGDRTDRLLEYAAGISADLLLVGERPGNRGRRATARRFAMKAPCSLWLAPRGSPPSLRRIVAGVDFSDSSLYGMALAIQLARAAGLSECIALHVEERPRRGLRQALERRAARACPPGFSIRVEIDRSPTVTEAAGRLAAGLIVVGARGDSPSATILLGGESDQLLRQSTAPVLVASPAAAREGLVELLLKPPPLARGAC